MQNEPRAWAYDMFTPLAFPEGVEPDPEDFERFAEEGMSVSGPI